MPFRTMIGSSIKYSSSVSYLKAIKILLEMVFYSFLHFAKFGIVMSIVLFSFWPVKELETPIYHRYKHEITHIRTHIHSYVCVKKMLVFNSKDHNLAIEKTTNFKPAKVTYIMSVSCSLCYTTRRITAIIPSTVEDVCVHSIP